MEMGLLFRWSFHEVPNQCKAARPTLAASCWYITEIFNRSMDTKHMFSPRIMLRPRQMAIEPAVHPKVSRFTRQTKITHNFSVCLPRSQVRKNCPLLCGVCGSSGDACADGKKDEHPLFLVGNETLNCTSLQDACHHDDEVDLKCKDQGQLRAIAENPWVSGRFPMDFPWIPLVMTMEQYGKAVWKSTHVEMIFPFQCQFMWDCAASHLW